MPGMWSETGAIVAVVLPAAGYVGWTVHRVQRVLDQRMPRRAAVVAERSDAIELYAAARLAPDAGEREVDLTRRLRTAPAVSAARVQIVTPSRPAGIVPVETAS
jgi:hypothetical protein